MLLYSYCNGFKNNNFWGFILTMWYVNYSVICTSLIVAVPFYINYVVCKLVIRGVIFFRYGWFYINYVVCKSRFIYHIFIIFIRFILTMWYVNANHSGLV